MPVFVVEWHGDGDVVLLAVVEQPQKGCEVELVGGYVYGVGWLVFGSVLAE